MKFYVRKGESSKNFTLNLTNAVRGLRFGPRTRRYSVQNGALTLGQIYQEENSNIKPLEGSLRAVKVQHMYRREKDIIEVPETDNDRDVILSSEPSKAIQDIPKIAHVTKPEGSGFRPPILEAYGISPSKGVRRKFGSSRRIKSSDNSTNDEEWNQFITKLDQIMVNRASEYL